MTETASTIIIEENNFYLNVYVDPFNKRIRVDDYRGNTSLVLKQAEELVYQHNAEKLIIKGRLEDLRFFYEMGLQPEVILDGYFLGSDAYFFSKFYTNDRKKNEHWLKEDEIIQNIYQLDKSVEKSYPPKEYELKKADESCAEQLSTLYRQVFEIYPTPLHDPEYVKKTMKEGTVYYVFFHDGKIVSAASAEMNLFYKNAELTDCATLPEYRGKY
ncbi:GNAT family N-acetyltransferase, partial [Bacillus xiapuensis]|nr:putative beta-lysine N-acetyltransferase [Bacillus xiapuensis]